ncbi:hypothetical protein KC318_g11880, partial [Hortaea werneckii]
EGLLASSQDGSEEAGHNPEQAIVAQPDFEHEVSYSVEHEESKSVEPGERAESTEHTGNSMNGQDSESDDFGQSIVAPVAESVGIALESEREPKAVHHVMEEICLVPSKVDLEELQCTDNLDSSVGSDEVGKEYAFTGGVAIDIPEEMCLIPTTPFMEQAQCTGVPSELTDKQEVGQDMVSDGEAETGISKDISLLPHISAEEPQYSQEGSSSEEARKGAQAVESDGEADGSICEVSLFSIEYNRFGQCSIDGEGEHTDTSPLL